VLVDPNIPPQESDQLLIDFLTATARPFLIVATKSDRLSGNQLTNALRKFTERHPSAQIVPFSAKSGVGKDQVWREVWRAAEAIQVARSQALL
jgi:GTP-binding protein